MARGAIADRGSYLGLEVAVDVPELVELADGSEHLADVEAGVLLLEHARVVEQGAEVAAGDVFHGEVDEGGVLEGVEEAHEPRRLGRRQDVPLDQDVSDLGARSGSGERRHARERERDWPHPS